MDTAHPKLRTIRFLLRSILFAGPAVSMLTGCHAGSGKREVVAIPLFSTESVSSCEHVGMDEAIEGTDLHLAWNGPSDGDTQRQIDLFNDAIKRHAYGITFNPRSLYAANGVIRDALAEKTPVVVLLHRLPLAPAKHLSFVVEDTDAAANMVATRLQQILPAHSGVLLVGLDSLSAGGEDRFTAVESAIRQMAPQVSIAGRITAPPTISAFESSIRDALAHKEDIRAIVALDSHAGYAAAAVLHNADTPQAIRVISFDQNMEVLASLRQGEVDSVVVQNMREIGHIAIANMIHDRAGEPVAPVTYVKPMLVTRDNIDSEAVQNILVMNWVQK